LGVIVWKGLLKVEEAVLVTLGLWLTATLTAEVIARYVFHSGIMLGFDELYVHILFWVYILGAVRATYYDKHLKAGLISTYIGTNERAQLMLKTVISFITLAVIAYITFAWGYPHFRWILDLGEQSSTYMWPMKYAKSSIFIGFLLITIYLVSNFITTTRRILHR